MSMKEFNEFKNSNKEPLPSSLSLNLFHRVNDDLNPSWVRVLGKLSVGHVLSALVTLSVCPQFGFRLFGEGHGLMHVFMELGKVGCPLVCGTFFLGTSILISTFLLSRDELRKLRRSRSLVLTSLVFVSLGFFKIMDGEFFLEFSILWTLGALFGGWIFLEGVWRARRPSTVLLT